MIWLALVILYLLNLDILIHEHTVLRRRKDPVHAAHVPKPRYYQTLVACLVQPPRGASAPVGSQTTLRCCCSTELHASTLCPCYIYQRMHGVIVLRNLCSIVCNIGDVNLCEIAARFLAHHIVIPSIVDFSHEP